MLGWCAEAECPDYSGQKQVEEGRYVHQETSGVEEIWVKANAVRKVMDKRVHQTHMIIGINAGKLDPFAAENLVIGEVNTNK